LNCSDLAYDRLEYGADELSRPHRLFLRTLRRTLTREELWSGNRESFRQAFFSRNSILLWAINTYSRRRREYPALFARPEYAHLQTVRLRSPRQTLAWLENINNPI